MPGPRNPLFGEAVARALFGPRLLIARESAGFVTTLLIRRVFATTFLQSDWIVVATDPDEAPGHGWTSAEIEAVRKEQERRRT